MILNDVWNAIAKNTSSFVNMLAQSRARSKMQEPDISPMAEPPEGDPSPTPYTADAKPLQISPCMSLFGRTPIPPPITASNLKSRSNELDFTNTSVIAETQAGLLRRPSLPGRSPNILHKSSININDVDSTVQVKYEPMSSEDVIDQVFPNIQVKSETIESGDLHFQGVSDMDTHSFVVIATKKNEPTDTMEVFKPSLEDVPTINIKVQPAADMEIFSAAADMEIFNAAADMEIFSPAADMEIFSPAADMEIFNPAADMEIFNPAANMDIFNPTAEFLSPVVNMGQINGRFITKRKSRSTAVVPAPQKDASVTPAPQDSEPAAMSKLTEVRTKMQEAILSAVRKLRDRNGSSGQKIRRFLSHQDSVKIDNSLFNIILKGLVADGILIQTKDMEVRGSFKLAIDSNNNAARKVLCPSADHSDKNSNPTRSIRQNITKFPDKKSSKSSRRDSKVQSGRRAESLHQLRRNPRLFIDPPQEISKGTSSPGRRHSPKRIGVKALTKGTHKAIKRNGKINKLKTEQGKKISTPFSTWYKTHSKKWNSLKLRRNLLESS